MSWILGTPDIPKGARRHFIITSRSLEGKIFVRSAFYMNAHVMPCSYDCEPGPSAVPHNPDEYGDFEDYEWTGWSLGNCEYCDTEWMKDLNVIAHMPFPEPFNPLATGQTDEGGES